MKPLLITLLSLVAVFLLVSAFTTKRTKQPLLQNQTTNTDNKQNTGAKKIGVLSITRKTINGMVCTSDGTSPTTTDGPHNFTPKKGLNANGFVITSANAEKVKFKSVRGPKFYISGKAKPQRTFTINRGETIHLSMAGILDVSINYIICYK